MVQEHGEELAKDLAERQEKADPTHSGRFVREHLSCMQACF